MTGDLFYFEGGDGCQNVGEAKLDFGGDNNSRDLKCLAGMISLNHLITYITAAACSAVCQCVCVHVSVSNRFWSVYLHLGSGKPVLESYGRLRSVCLNMW